MEKNDLILQDFVVIVNEEMAHVLKPAERSFNLQPSSYPLSCIRLQPVQRCPHGDLQWALGSFLSDIRDRLQSVCGLQARLSNKHCYRTAGVNTVATVQVQTHILWCPASSCACWIGSLTSGTEIHSNGF